MSKKQARQIENMALELARVRASASIAQQIVDARDAAAEAAAAPPPAAPPPPPPAPKPLSVREQFRKLAPGSPEQREFLMTRQADLLAEADTSDRFGRSVAPNPFGGPEAA